MQKKRPNPFTDFSQKVLLVTSSEREAEWLLGLMNEKAGTSYTLDEVDYITDIDDIVHYAPEEYAYYEAEPGTVPHDIMVRSLRVPME